jgi:type IV secretory pathway VirB9-like protein
MYTLSEHTGEVVTIKFNNGIEIIALHAGYDTGSESLTVSNPRTVVVNDKELALIPYMFTGESEFVVLQSASIQSLSPTTQPNAQEYKRIVGINT